MLNLYEQNNKKEIIEENEKYHQKFTNKNEEKENLYFEDKLKNEIQMTKAKLKEKINNLKNELQNLY